MFKTFAVSICVASAVLIGAPAIAQEMKAERMTNVNYHTVEFIKFHEGKRARAGEIVDEYFIPADRDAKLPGPSAAYHMMSGEWDYVIVWNMKGGMADMEWAMHPDEVTWRAALAKRAGGDAGVKKLMDEWNSLVSRKVQAIAHSHYPAK